MKTENQFDLLALAPTSDLMLGTWLGCLHWAIGSEEIVERFRAETGIRWTPAQTPIERMVDEATGADARFIEEFVRWMNRTIWGEVDGRACNGNEDELGEETGEKNGKV